MLAARLVRSVIGRRYTVTAIATKYKATGNYYTSVCIDLAPNSWQTVQRDSLVKAAFASLI
jgi:hypothetical protein